MAVGLIRGDKTPVHDGVNTSGHIIAYIGWSETPFRENLITKIKKVKPVPVECDIAVVLLADNNRIQEQSDLIFHNNRVHSKTNAIQLLSQPYFESAGEAYNEQIEIYLDALGSEYDKIQFIGCIYDADKRKQDFDMIDDMYITLIDVDYNYEICRFYLQQDYKELSSMFIGEIHRYEYGWEFEALGNGSHDVGIMHAIKRYT
ncbi:MAG: TerD family protein [Lachnospiraceae bacterium]|nr:TerD family protein [Lachnospiraceae bacterium]